MVEKNTVRLHAIVEGYVQGVGFRMFVQTTANALGVNGWVRNLWNGNVEVVAEGEKSVLEKLNYYLLEGPRGADVINVHSEWLDATNEFERFQVRPNG